MKNAVTIPSADSIDYTLSIVGDKIECRVHRIDTVNFNKRDVAIEGSGFKQKDVEAPDFWSDTAVRIVANKYFRGHDNDRESSVKQLVARVVGSIVDFLDSKDRFASATDKHSFKSVLTHLLYVQAFAFNSPVWFNLGTEVSPQCSACFILGVDDNIESILKWINDESLVFRRGSGAGVNISRIRHKNARLQGGGHASGPLSFANGANYMAGAIKSGGKTRRAAKMLVMNDNHPDVFDFIDTKSIAERVAKALIAGGFSSKFNAEGGAYELAPWQNANNSVSLYDRFLNAVLVDGDHDLVDHKGAVVRTIKARELWRKMGEAAWESGDPGLHFRDTMNRFNTVAEDGEIEASNPCSEYLFINNTSCNLASFNLVRYMIRDGLKRVFNWRAFQRDGLAMYLCLDAIVDISSYPTPEIDETTRKYRTLGAGYANIGGMLMRMGIPYDSDEGRHMIAVITSALQGTMVCNSMKAAEAWGTFDRYEANSDHVDKVILSHYNAQVGLTYSKDNVVWNPWSHYEQTVLRDNTKLARVRNAQFTVVAPTGTIGFMMDVDTTGIEPDFSLVKYKEMVGGGYMTLVNTAMSEGLEVLGYDEETRKAIEAHVTTTGGVVEGAPGLKPEHYGVFDCAVAAFGGTRFIRPEAHIEAMAEAQPFLSGAISKTVNMPESSTVDDILDIYMKSWKLGLKAVAVYRDNCKQSQPLSTSKTTDKGSATVILESAPATSMSYDDMTICKLEAQIKDLKSIIGSLRRGERERLSTSHMGHIHKFTIQGMSGHLTVGFYDDGRIGEVFVEMSKEGSTVGGFLDAWSKAFSLMLQYGAPLNEVLQKFEGSRFEPSGFTLNENIRTCTSVIDYVSRYMKMLSSSAPKVAPMLDSAPGDHQAEEGEDVDDSHVPSNTQKFVDTNGRICSSCGSSNLRQSGACFVCNECGSSTGCG